LNKKFTVDPPTTLHTCNHKKSTKERKQNPTQNKPSKIKDKHYKITLSWICQNYRVSNICQVKILQYQHPSHAVLQSYQHTLKYKIMLWEVHPWNGCTSATHKKPISGLQQ
jgi:hypothetical protein